MRNVDSVTTIYIYFFKQTLVKRKSNCKEAIDL